MLDVHEFQDAAVGAEQPDHIPVTVGRASLCFLITPVGEVLHPVAEIIAVDHPEKIIVVVAGCIDILIRIHPIGVGVKGIGKREGLHGKAVEADQPDRAVLRELVPLGIGANHALFGVFSKGGEGNRTAIVQGQPHAVALLLPA